jgi:outer membrane receptor protein involved in Fe transport
VHQRTSGDHHSDARHFQPIAKCAAKLLHIGSGFLLYQLNDHSPTTNSNDSSIGLTGVPNPGGRFPTLAGLCSGTATGTNTTPCTNGGIVRFPYASFLLGLVNTGVVNPPADVRTGKRFLAFFAQDSWKVTRKLTFEYGLRYDHTTYPKEQYGRLPSINPTLANPTVGGYRAQ